MQTEIFQLIKIVYPVGFTLSIFFSIALYQTRVKNPANVFLAAFIFIFALLFFGGILSFYQLNTYYPHLRGLHWPLKFLFAPLFYLYIKHLVGPALTKWQMMPHFVPFIVSSISYIPFWTLSAADKRSLEYTSSTMQEILPSFDFQFNIVQIVIYLILTWVIFKRHKNCSMDWSADSGLVNIPWLNSLLLTMVVISIWYAIIYSVLGPGSGIFIHIPIICALFYLGVKAVNQQSIFRKSPEYNLALENPENALIQVEKKYMKSRLSEQEINQIWKKLEKDFLQNESFLDPDLTLEKLSKLVGCKPHYLSQVINTRAEQKFYEFINTHRIKKAMQELENAGDNKPNISKLAYQCGFNSKSVFYNSFKKHTGNTPSAYYLYIKK